MKTSASIKIRNGFMVKLLSLLFLLDCSMAVFANDRVMPWFDGSDRQLADYRSPGTWSILMIWSANCLICNHEAPVISAFHERYKNTKAVVIGISIDGRDGRDAAQGFLQRHAVRFPSVIAEPETVAEFYFRMTGDQWYGTPTFLVLDPEGHFRRSFTGRLPLLEIEALF